MARQKRIKRTSLIIRRVAHLRKNTYHELITTLHLIQVGKSTRPPEELTPRLQYNPMDINPRGDECKCSTGTQHFRPYVYYSPVSTRVHSRFSWPFDDPPPWRQSGSLNRLPSYRPSRLEGPLFNGPRCERKRPVRVLNSLIRQMNLCPNGRRFYALLI